MTVKGVTIRRSHYVAERLGELIVKTLVRRAAKRREGFGRLAVIPTDFVGMNVIANGFYERHELTILQRLIQSQNLAHTTALDIGANIGNHTTVFSKLFQSVIAFEPNPSVAALLETNVFLSGSKNVEVKRVGLGPKDAVLPFTPDVEGNDGHGSFAIKGAVTIDLPVRNGDDFLSEIDQEISSGRRPIGFIKCDVEGFEASVFAGLQKTLTNHSPIIVFESDERGAGAEAFAILKQCGYRHLYVIRETGDEIKNRFRRELKRLASSYQFWLEELDDAPGFWANVVVTKRPLT
jgi:FkbM family methyltransferase